MKKLSFTIHHSILINKGKEEVWDFTQDYSMRSKWDKSVLDTRVIQSSPSRVVQLKMKGNFTMTFVYKLDDRPNKTTLAIQDIDSKWIAGGGGSWLYEDKNDGTLWSMTNSLAVRPGIFIRFILPFLRILLNRQTCSSMKRAKRIMENS